MASGVEVIGWALFLALAAYRLGWTTGARRMAAAIAGRPTGWDRVKVWWRHRKAEAAVGDGNDNGMRVMTLQQFVDKMADLQAQTQAQADQRDGPEQRGGGQYL
jgi:hypothetical protein